jgi:hypothetical protein
MPDRTLYGHHVRMTVDVPANLLDEAIALAAARGQSLSELVERGLRSVIEESRDPTHVTYHRHTVTGNGVQPGVREGDWQILRSLAYEDHGG